MFGLDSLVDTPVRQLSLGERMRTQVEHLNPFRKIVPAGRDATPELIGEMTPSAAVAVGLALRRSGD